MHAYRVSTLSIRIRKVKSIKNNCRTNTKPKNSGVVILIANKENIKEKTTHVL